MQGFERMFLAFAHVCDAEHLPYAFTGAMAVMAWGNPRYTQHADALIDLPDERVDEFVMSLQTENLLANADHLRIARANGSWTAVADANSPFELRVRVTTRDHERKELSASPLVPYEGHAIRIARPEETVAYKLARGSPLDLQDAAGIVQRQREKLDRKRLSEIAADLGIPARIRPFLDQQDFLVSLIQESSDASASRPRSAPTSP